MTTTCREDKYKELNKPVLVTNTDLGAQKVPMSFQRDSPCIIRGAEAQNNTRNSSNHTITETTQLITCPKGKI